MPRTTDLATLTDAELDTLRGEAQAEADELRSEREADPDDEGQVECAGYAESKAAILADDCRQELARRHPTTQDADFWDFE